MKSVTFLVSVLLATAMTSQANAHGKRDPLARQAAMSTIIQAVDAGTAASIETRAKLIREQHARLRTLQGTSPSDNTAIRAARKDLRNTRDEMGEEIQRVLTEQPELRTRLKQQRSAFRQQRLLTRFTVANDEAFATLLNSAPQALHEQLSINRGLLADARATVREARDNGATRTQIKSLRRSSRDLYRAQRSIIGQILGNDEQAQAQLLAMASDAGFNHKRKRWH